MNPTRFVPFLLLGAALTAQRIVVVDTNNGPGTDHTTLTSAFAALLDGDVLIVRAGTYVGASLTTLHSFTMLGEGDPVVEPSATGGSPLRITMSGSQYQHVSIRGMSFNSMTTGQWALHLRTNYNWWPAPTAHLEDCVVVSLSPDADRVGLLAESIGLTAQRCFLNTTQVSGCLATFVECTIAGLDQSWHGTFSQHAQTALDVIRSEVWIVDSTLSAGDSNGVYGSPASCIGFTESSYTVTSKVHVAGSSSLRADQTPHPSWPAPYVFHNYQTWWPLPSNVDHEPSVAMAAAPLGANFSAGIAVAVETVPTLVASTAPLAGSFACTAHGAPGDVAIFVVGTASRAQSLLGMSFLVDTAAAVVADFGVFDGAGQCTFAPIAVPNQQSLLGTTLEASSLVLTAAGALRASNPVSGILQ